MIGIAKGLLIKRERERERKKRYFLIKETFINDKAEKVWPLYSRISFFARLVRFQHI